jgi:hypothetical protein
MRFPSVAASFLLPFMVLAQQPTDSKSKTPPSQTKQDQPPPGDSGEPLFQKKSSYKSSGKSKESATLAFNGIDPSGKVSNSVLASSATSTDDQKVQQMASRVPKPKQLQSFLKDGGLTR